MHMCHASFTEAPADGVPGSQPARRALGADHPHSEATTYAQQGLALHEEGLGNLYLLA